MNKLKDFNSFIYDYNSDDYYITEKINISKYQNSIKKFFRETKLNLYYVLTFGTSLSVLLPVVEKFMKSGNFEIQLNDRNITLLTIYAFSILLHESNDKIKKLYDIIKERDINDEDVKKSVNILRNIHELFKITFEGTGKVVDNFLDMISYSAMFIPFMSVINSLVTDGKISTELMSDTFQTLSLTIGDTGIKLLSHRILHKIDKIIKGTNKFQNKENVKPLIVNDEFKSPMYRSENIKLQPDLTESVQNGSNDYDYINKRLENSVRGNDIKL